MTRFAGALSALALGALAACSSFSGGGGSGASFGERLMLAGPTVPPSMPEETSDVYCPTVGVIEGGAALQAYSGGRVGDAAALRNQITLGQLARECTGQPDGTTQVRVGVEGRALLGAGAGSGGTFSVPVRVVLKRGERVIATRVRTASVTIPAGETQGSFIIVEEGLSVPAADAQTFDIEVGLGGAGAATEGRSRRRRG
jgi:hypothetical protein